MSFAGRIRKVLPPVLAIAAGVVVLMMLVRTRPEAPKRPHVELPPLVTTVVARATDHPVRVRVQGTVIPEREVTVRPQVGGRIVKQSRGLVPGGRFGEGDTMVRIESRDYELAIERQRAVVSRARMELDLERSRGAVARREWQMLGDEKSSGEDEALALRGPQLRAAEGALRSAESGLEQAELDLSRTSVRAPFNALVLDEFVEYGQLVTPQSVIARLVGTDAFWVQVSVPVEALSWLRFPKEDLPGSFARVWQDTGAASIKRSGRVLRLLPALDQVGRMARLLVEIEDPMGEGNPDGGLPLLLGAYVHVELDGSTIPGAIEVPRVALRDGAVVHVASPKDTLEIRGVRIAWRDEKSVWVTEGLRDGERIVTSRLSGAVEGMKLRVAEPPASKARASTEAPRP